MTSHGPRVRVQCHCGSPTSQSRLGSGQGMDECCQLSGAVNLVQLRRACTGTAPSSVGIRRMPFNLVSCILASM